MRTQILALMGERRWDRYAEMVAGGCDYDEMCQQATDEIAKEIGFAEGTQEYEMLADIVGQGISEELSSDFRAFEDMLKACGGNPDTFWDAVGNTENAEDAIFEILWANIADDTEEDTVEELAEIALRLMA